MKVLLTGSEGMLGSILKMYWRGIYDMTFIDLKLDQDLNTCELPIDVDAVVHLAGKSGVRESLNDPKGYWENNVLATKRLFDFYTCPIYYASSSTAKEPDKNPYAYTKFIIERYAKDHCIGLRFTTMYGSDLRPNMFIPKLLKNDVDYINNHSRDFIHIADVCSAITMIMNSKLKGVIDIGTGTSIHLSKLIQARGLKNIPMREGSKHERKDNTADITQLTSIGWKPRIDVIDFITPEKTLDKEAFSKYNVTIGDQS